MAGFSPVGSAPVDSITGAVLVGTYIQPDPGVLVLGGATYTPLLGLKISKANIAVESHPTPAVIFSKANVAVESHPTPAVILSKTNLAIESILVASTSRGCVTIIW